MRIKVLAFVASLLLISNCSAGIPQSASSTTSSPQTTVQRDASTVSLLSQVVGVLGGSSLSPSVGIVAQGTLAASTGGISGPIRWETSGAEFRYERPGPNGTIVFVSGHGNPAIVDGGKVRQNIVHLVTTNLPPHMVVSTLASHLSNSAIQLSPVQQVTLNGAPALKVSTVDTSDELSLVVCKQDWYLDARTLLPIRVEFLASEAMNALDTARMTYIFSNWQKVSGVLMPFQVATLFEGQQISVVSFDSIQVGVSIPTTDFDVPAGTSGGAL